jgi:hypothetical protein
MMADGVVSAIEVCAPRRERKSPDVWRLDCTKLGKEHRQWIEDAFDFLVMADAGRTQAQQLRVVDTPLDTAVRRAESYGCALRALSRLPGPPVDLLADVLGTARRILEAHRSIKVEGTALENFTRFFVALTREAIAESQDVTDLRPASLR